MVRHRKPEQRFQSAFKKLLERKGYLVIIVYKPRFTHQLFDMIAIKSGTVYFLELKSKDTWYPPTQRELQKIMAEKHNLNFVVVQQSKQRGKIKFLDYTQDKLIPGVGQLAEDLKELIEAS